MIIYFGVGNHGPDQMESTFMIVKSFCVSFHRCTINMSPFNFVLEKIKNEN